MSYADDPKIPVLNGQTPSGTAINAYVSSVTFTTAPIFVGDFSGYSVSASCPATGSPVGTFKLQGCNDLEKVLRTSVEFTGAELTNWFDVATGGDRIVSGAASTSLAVLLTDPSCQYRWMRIVYTASSGSITATIKIQRKKLVR